MRRIWKKKTEREQRGTTKNCGCVISVEKKKKKRPESTTSYPDNSSDNSGYKKKLLPEIDPVYDSDSSTEDVS